MEIINAGSEDVFELQNLTCCYPMGTLSSFAPEQ